MRRTQFKSKQRYHDHSKVTAKMRVLTAALFGSFPGFSRREGVYYMMLLLSYLLASSYFYHRGLPAIASHGLVHCIAFLLFLLFFYTQQQGSGGMHSRSHGVYCLRGGKRRGGVQDVVVTRPRGCLLLNDLFIFYFFGSFFDTTVERGEYCCC